VCCPQHPENACRSNAGMANLMVHIDQGASSIWPRGAISMIRIRAVFVVPVVAALALASVPAAEAEGPARSLAQVGSTPASYTPWLLKTVPDQYVRQIAQCGDTMYAVGRLSAIGQGSDTYTRGNAFSFSATTGAVSAWDPQVNGEVKSVTTSPDCSTVYLGGIFSSAGGVPAGNLVAVDAATGEVKAEFAHDAGSEVDTVVYARGMLLVGGTFVKINGVDRQRLASLDPTTGAVTDYADLSIEGAFSNTWTRIFKAQLSHDGNRLLVEGVFKQIDGQPRQQVAMLDLGATSLTLDPWYPSELNRHCRQLVSFYARAAAWSPDDKKVYVATTGHKPSHGRGSSLTGPRKGPCDAAIAFPSSGTDVTHTWINYTGCDSLYGIAADPGTVYLTGHERWANNGHACEKAGKGSVSRPGLGALGAHAGRATAWNPGRSLGHGGDDLLLTDDGLWVASDNFTDGLAQICGGQTNKGGICFLPRMSTP
jgi:hypothetical protein